MNPEEKVEFLKELKSAVMDKIDVRRDVSDEEIEDIIAHTVFEKSANLYVSPSEKREFVETVFNSMRRLDVIQPLLDDNEITEIMVNGPDDIFIESEGRVRKYYKKFESVQKLEDVIQNIVSKVNRSVNEASPICDARLSDGSRVSVVLPPVALNGPILTIRKFSQKPMTIDQLIKYKSVTSEVAELLERMVKAKYNIFICGGTGSGKTTFLNALSNFIPRDERIITIEDSAELQIVGVDNIVKLETRNANTEGKGEIPIRELIKASLRMRPERIVVGEVRGAEAIDMLQAMNTGHDGSLSTGHANSPKDMLSRIETMVLSGASLPIEAIRQQIASAIEIIIFVSRLRDKTRRTLEIAEVVGTKDGEIVLNSLYIFTEDEEEQDGTVIGSLRRTENDMVNKAKFKAAGISDKV